jgi:hypothetical protein
MVIPIESVFSARPPPAMSFRGTFAGSCPSLLLGTKYWFKPPLLYLVRIRVDSNPR